MVEDITREIFGDERLSDEARAVAFRCIDWCANNPSRLAPSSDPGKDVLLSAIDISLKELYGKGIADYFVRKKTREFVDVRNIAMLIYYQRSRATLLQMEPIFNRHHATMLHAFRQVKNLCEVDREYRDRFKMIKEKVQECEKRLTSLGECGSSEVSH